MPLFAIAAGEAGDGIAALFEAQADGPAHGIGGEAGIGFAFYFGGDGELWPFYMAGGEGDVVIVILPQGEKRLFLTYVGIHGDAGFQGEISGWDTLEADVFAGLVGAPEISLGSGDGEAAFLYGALTWVIFVDVPAIRIELVAVELIADGEGQGLGAGGQGLGRVRWAGGYGEQIRTGGGFIELNAIHGYDAFGGVIGLVGVVHAEELGAIGRPGKTVVAGALHVISLG